MGRRLPLIVLLAFAFVSVGCGSNRGRVTGTVTYNREPVPSGTVTFFVAGAAPVAVPITNGHYDALNVPLGEAMVAVVSLKTEAAPAPKSGKQMGARGSEREPIPSNIPAGYGNPATSDLRFQVEKGVNTFPIDLK
jgi:hypothetical protein